ncbi:MULTISPECIES: DUF2622 domain-containing protein [Cronobacter]|uniref:DUF2622 domain-containing protein n=2 Tax=Enterobacteriaceae TaxID=543 RepID=UPI0013ED3961|nr:MULTISPECIES: DUF2622 domain-containing protein [Cronobacter]KAF6592572.1 DUF2622 domain-containing protein [Cronobacter sp. EKM102R]MDK1233936.1 DUF2622 domain-containing protein [Cronobacter turicensis]HDI3022753.1 DUF2622 domain-containing protein [Cronobacter turicensis]HDI3035754.1 DUF2622 domain-containing protein [Cronobacter turicensis]
MFSVRVELRNSETADYTALHEKMKAHGFYQFTRFPGSDDFFSLPDAEYVFYNVSGTESVSYVGHLAKNIAQQIRPNPRIVVYEIKDSFQLGLDKF